MKFTHTENTSYRKGIGSVPKPWIDYDKNHKKTIEQYLEDHVKVWDADFCGDITVDFLFEDGKTYRLEYSWYCNEHGEEDEYGEKPWIIDEYYIEEIALDAAKVPEKKIGRDWI